MPVNLPNLFTKSSSKKKQTEDNTPPSSPDKRVPEKRPSLKPARSPTKDRERTTRAASSSKSSSRNSKKLDTDTHPLNLPPEQIRRLSALSGMSEQRNSSDVDRESTSSPKPQSPSPNGVPGAFPKQNGTHNDDDEVRPVPPPHRTPTSPPPQQQAPPPANPVDAEALKAAGNKLHKQGNYAQAIKEYTKAIEADPKNPIYRNNRAASYMGIEQYAEALEDTRFADELEPMNPKYLHRMAKIFPKLGRPGEAVEIYQRIGPPAIAKEKEAAEWMHNQLTTAENQIKSGKEFLNAAAELQSATNDLLRAAPGSKGGSEDAVAWAKKMEELISHANSLIQRRSAAQLQRLAAGGDNKKLVEKAEELAKSTKDNVMKEGRERMQGAIVALKWAEQGLGSSVKPPRRWKLLEAEAYLERGDGGQAKKLLTPLLRENMAEPEALVLMGRIHYSEGENEEAIKHFRKALSGDPEHKEAVKYFRLVQKVNRLKEEGNTFFKTGSFKSAIEKYTEAIELDSKTSGTRSKLLQNRGLCHTKLKNWQQAIDDCTEALDLDASYTKAKKTRAKALGESGDWEAALKDWQAIQEKDGQTQETASEIRKIELEIKKSKRKDYYKILGVDKEAGDSEIKRAYRKLAVVHHPDKNPGDPDADNRFKDIGEAYETLSDPQKRQRYDSGEDLLDPSDMFGGGGMGGMGGGVQVDPSMLFNMFGGGGGMGGMGGGQGGGFHFAQGGSPFGGGGMPGGGRSRGGQHFHFG